MSDEPHPEASALDKYDRQSRRNRLWWWLVVLLVFTLWWFPRDASSIKCEDFLIASTVIGWMLLMVPAVPLALALAAAAYFALLGRLDRVAELLASVSRAFVNLYRAGPTLTVLVVVLNGVLFYESVFRYEVSYMDLPDNGTRIVVSDRLTGAVRAKNFTEDECIAEKMQNDKNRQ